MDESTGPSNQVVDDIVVHTLNRDDVPITTTNVPEVQNPKTEQIIEEDADVPYGDGVEETQGESSSTNPAYKYMSSHPADLIISDPNTGVRTRSFSINTFLTFNAFISQVEPKNIKEALLEADWICAMQEELAQFERNKVWHLVLRPSNKSVIGTRWVFRNNLDEAGFEKIMTSEFEMSMIGELSFFLGLQVI